MQTRDSTWWHPGLGQALMAVGMVCRVHQFTDGRSILGYKCFCGVTLVMYFQILLSLSGRVFWT